MTFDARDHLRFLVENPDRVLGRPATWSKAVAFLVGYNHATGFALLRGFEEWLFLRVRWGDNVHWTALLVADAFHLGPGQLDGFKAHHVHEEGDAVRIVEVALAFLDDMNDTDKARAIAVAVDRLFRADEPGTDESFERADVSSAAETNVDSLSEEDGRRDG